MYIDYRWVQTRLTALGFNPGPIDGVRGPRTDAAVVAFKRSIGFWARPYIGPLTLEALKSADPDRSDIPWMAEAQRVRGLHEQRNRSQLRTWFDASVNWIDPMKVPWCAAFVNAVLKATGVRGHVPAQMAAGYRPARKPPRRPQLGPVWAALSPGVRRHPRVLARLATGLAGSCGVLCRPGPGLFPRPRRQPVQRGHRHPHRPHPPAKGPLAGG